MLEARQLVGSVSVDGMVPGIGLMQAVLPRLISSCSKGRILVTTRMALALAGCGDRKVAVPPPDFMFAGGEKTASAPLALIFVLGLPRSNKDNAAISGGESE